MARDREQALTPPFIGRVWLLGALFLVTVPHLIRMPIWLSVGCSGLFLWRALHELRGYDLPAKWLRYFLTAIAVGAVLFSYRSLVGHEAGVALLTLMLCLKLLELRTMRDALIALFIGYFMVIGGFIFSQSIFMGAYLFAVVLTLTAALVALNHPGGNAAFNRYYIASGGKLLLQAIPLMVVMFILFPRLSNPLWHMPDLSNTARTGLGDSIEMGSISNLVQSEAVAFRVDFDDDIPAADNLYWRGPVLWQTDGRRWERQRFGIQRQLPKFEALGNEIAYTVILEPHSRRWVFALDLPLQRPSGGDLDIYLTPDFQLLNSSEIRKKLRYHARSATRYQFDEMSFDMEFAATRLPDGINPRTHELAAQWLLEDPNPAAIVQRGYNLFRDRPFFYTRQPPILDDDDPVDQFLFDSRRGFCEHYATAFVTLMRAADIPARVVTGYQGGELNDLGDYLIVRQANAHAWAEVWLDGQGWVRVDPTTAVPPSRVESGSDAVRFTSTEPASIAGDFPRLRKFFSKLRFGWDAINHSWNQWVLGFDREKQRQLLQKLGLGKLSWEWLGILMIGTIAAILTIFAALSFLRRPRQRDPLVRLYDRFCSNLESAGISRRRDEGPADFAERVIQQRPDLEPEVRKIIRLYIRLRYTAHSASADLDSLRRLVRGFKPGAASS